MSATTSSAATISSSRGMIDQLPPETVQHGHVLVAVRANTRRDGHAHVRSRPDRSPTWSADFVVFALPFSTLRDVDLTPLRSVARRSARVIETMGMGTNAKVHLELTHKTWPALGFSGAAYGEWHRLACGWDDCVPLGPDASPALYVAFPGGRVGRSGLTGAAHGPAPRGRRRLGSHEKSTTSSRAPPPRTPVAHTRTTGRLTRGSKAPTPTTASARPRATPQPRRTPPKGPYLFAGEHTSSENIGFLDGAVETGERTARQLFRRVGV